MTITEIKFSDHWWIDIPCFMVFFLMLTTALIVSLMGVEISLHTIFPKNIWIAPIAEEAFKFLAISFGTSFGVMFTGIFAATEFSNFLTWAIMHEKDVPTFYIMRFICVGLHFLTFAIQLFGFHMYYKYKNGLYLLLGFLSATFIHYKWNLIFGRFVYINVVDGYNYLSNFWGL